MAEVHDALGFGLNPKDILVLAPHTDDGEIGAGGTISRLVRGGARVRYVAFSSADQSVPDGFPSDVLRTEVLNATKVLGVAEEDVTVFDYEVRKLSYHRQDVLEHMVRLREESPPDFVLAPSVDDLHQDHEVVAKEALRAFKLSTILAYEIPWNRLEFRTSAFVRLDPVDVDTKVRALTCYESQRHRAYLSEEFVRSQAKFRGVQVGMDHAEAFDIVRLVL